jgi:hypothetical protein
MIPIYNIEHGREDLARNEETFSEGENILAKGGVLLIFPEGLSRIERVLLPLKKGTARVALRAATKMEFKSGLTVIPVGINYTQHRFRGDVLLCAGEPVSIDAYRDAYRLQPNKVLTDLTRRLQETFSETVLYVKQPERTDLVNHLLLFYQNDTLRRPFPTDPEALLTGEKNLCELVSAMDERTEALQSDRIRRYMKGLNENLLRDQSVTGRYRFALLHFLLLLFGLPFMLAGFLFGVVPFLFTRWLAGRTVTRADFYTSVFAASGGLIFFLWWIAWLGVAAVVAKPGLLYLLLPAPLYLFIAVNAWEAVRAFLAHLRYIWLDYTNRALVTSLRALREEICIWKHT